MCLVHEPGQFGSVEFCINTYLPLPSGATPFPYQNQLLTLCGTRTKCPLLLCQVVNIAEIIQLLTAFTTYRGDSAGVGHYLWLNSFVFLGGTHKFW